MWCAIYDILEHKGEFLQELFAFLGEGEDAVVDSGHIEFLENLGEILCLFLNFLFFCRSRGFGSGEKVVGELVALCFCDLGFALLVFRCRVLLFAGLLSLLAELWQGEIRCEGLLLWRALWKRYLVCTVHQRFLRILADLLLSLFVDYHSWPPRQWWRRAFRL